MLLAIFLLCDLTAIVTMLYIAKQLLCAGVMVFLSYFLVMYIPLLVILNYFVISQ